MSKSKVTLEDIASLLNVSKNTVSKALRGAPGVSDELREKICNLAVELNYKKLHKNNLNLTYNITLICRKTFLIDETFWAKVLYGITNYASQNNIKLNIVNVDENKEDKSDTISSILANDIDGIIIAGTISDNFLKKIKNSRIPFIVIDHYSEEIECDYINTSNQSGIYKLVKHLYKNGHKKIGFISNYISAHSFEERLDAFKKYMNYFKLPINENYLWLEAQYIETNYLKNNILSTINNDNFPTAWVCVNDNTALTFIKALNEIGLKVPEDVSVVGFDNISVSSFSELTTINIPKEIMGQKALEQLIYRIKNPSSPFIDIRLSISLIERNSVKNIS